MHAYMRIEYTKDAANAKPEVLHAAPFNFAETHLIYAAHAYLRAYMPKEDGLDPADVRLYVWTADPREAPVEEELLHEDAILIVPATLVTAEPDLGEMYDNPYP